MIKYTYNNCIVLRVVDGDTIELLIRIGFDITIKKNVRLYGIDAYETRLGRGTTQAQKEKGLEGKQFLKDMIEGKLVSAQTIKDRGKYGRYIAKVKFKNKCICKIMVDNGYAVYKDY